VIRPSSAELRVELDHAAEAKVARLLERDVEQADVLELLRAAERVVRGSVVLVPVPAICAPWVRPVAHLAGRVVVPAVTAGSARDEWVVVIVYASLYNAHCWVPSAARSSARASSTERGPFV